MHAPRDYQLRAITAIRDAFKAGKKGVAVEIFTGGGKSRIIATIAQLAQAKGRRVLVLVNRDNLCGQLFQSLIEQGLHPVMERGMDKASPMSNLVVGSVQTMQSDRLLKWNPSHFGLVITDEAQFAASDTFKNTLNHFKSAWHLFMSATLERHDGAGLWGGVEEVVFRMPIKRKPSDGIPGGIDEGWLVPYVREELPVPITMEDTEAANVTEDNQGNMFSAKNYLPRLFSEAAIRFEGKHGLNFWPSCDASREADRHFKDHGIDSMHIDGYMTDRQIREIKEWFITPGPKTCHCADYFSYGYDNKLIDAIGMMRICRSVGMTLQRIGRATRPNCIVDGLPDAMARRAAIAASVKPSFKIYDLMLQMEGMEARFADATSLITADLEDQVFIREEIRKSNGQITMDEIEDKLKAKHETDREKQLAKLATDAANAAEKKRDRELSLRTVYVGDIVLKKLGEKPSTSAFRDFVRSMIRQNGLICSFSDDLTAAQVMKIKLRVESRIKKLGKPIDSQKVYA